MKSKSSIISISIMLLMLIFTGACLSDGNRNIYISKTESATQTSTATPLPSLTPSPQETSTPTMTPSPSPTPFVTWTPLPTLALVEAQVRFKEWLVGSPECRLPCWAGITPSENTWQEALHIIDSVLDVEEVLKNYKCSFGLCNGFLWVHPNEITVWGIILTKGDNPIWGMDISIQQSFDEISLDAFLTANGPPEKVYISTQTLFMEGETLPFDIVLAYPEKKFVIRFFRYARIQGDNIVSCGRIEVTFLSIGWDEDGAWTEDWIKTATYTGGDKEIAYLLQDIEDVTDMTIESFYEALKLDGEACISTPREYWP